MPPGPPEHKAKSERVLRIVMIGFLWNIFKQSEERKKTQRILLQVTSPGKRLERADDGMGTFSADRIMLKHLRAGLDRDLEAEREKTSTLSESEAITNALDSTKLPLPIRKALRGSLKSLANFANEVVKELKSKGVLATLEPIKYPLTDQAFIDRFGYNGVVRGLNDEIIALLPIPGSGHPVLLLGMPVQYSKKLRPSGHTGPLMGNGKIKTFLFPSREGDIIPDQVIDLEVQTEQGIVSTLLSPDEIAEMS